MTMNTSKVVLIITFLSLVISGCVSKKKYLELQNQFDEKNLSSEQAIKDIGRLSRELSSCEQNKARLEASLEGRRNEINQLQSQIDDVIKQRDKTVEQISDLTDLSQSANQNISATLAQLEGKDKYIRLLQAAKTKTDSINLALAVNLKSVLSEGIEDDDVEIKVDKTVVFINLSDKMLYQSGSYKITPKASDVLGKIAKIVQSRPELEIMVEGYTDNVPIKNDCIGDNWDLSVLRATSVVRALQNNHGVDPNRLIAAGRGEYNVLADNDTASGRSINRRTRIIILPKIDQFYDLLNPDKVPD